MDKKILLGLAVSVLLIFGHFQRQCLDMKYAGTIVTTEGVYCWRRVNSSFDNFEALDKLQADAEKPYSKPVAPIKKVNL